MFRINWNRASCISDKSDYRTYSVSDSFLTSFNLEFVVDTVRDRPRNTGDRDRSLKTRVSCIAILAEFSLGVFSIFKLEIHIPTIVLPNSQSRMTLPLLTKRLA